MNQLKKVLPKATTSDDVVFLCIGTDRSTGDSLGPLVGTYLERIGYKVFGTLENPTHAVNLIDITNELPDDKTVIAIDACLGSLAHVGRIKVGKGTLKPGAGVDKDLPEVGDFYITGTVNVGGFMEYFVLQNTRLSLVMNMAEQIVWMVTDAIPISEKVIELVV